MYPRTATLEPVQAEYATQLSGAVADENIVDMGKADNPQIVLSVARPNFAGDAASRRLGLRQAEQSHTVQRFFKDAGQYFLRKLLDIVEFPQVID
ncbi:MAG: hypothetical protein LBF87_07860 [Treponema sp.]|nr:hypothetical protein [Treponema sp.]